MTKFNIENSTVNQLNDSGDNIQIAAPRERRGFGYHLTTWYGLLGTTITVVGSIIGVWSWLT